MEQLAERWLADRDHLRAVAYRMLGSASEADDAVQEAWIRVSRADTSEVENLRGWLTTVVARVCLDMLRSRKSRREDALDGHAERVGEGDPEAELALADSVGVALLIVLETLPPAERVAFVLHDLFDVSFDEIARIVDRSEVAARQLASRARRRVQGAPRPDDAAIARQRAVVEAFVAAARGGSIDALLAVLDPDVVLRADRAAVPAGAETEARGAEVVARRASQARARHGTLAVVDGAVGIVVAPRGVLRGVLTFTFAHDRITSVEVIADPERLRALDISVLPA
ncbi:sigma-70 family RNA polymerase sigma factor [Sandaracinus amylolyticus]|nr:sigma-70 family RNA polymerase sigma factor [Sandaracinus amylolyticus]